MARTAVNVLGNCMATAVVARWEGVDLTPVEHRQFQVESLSLSEAAFEELEQILPGCPGLF